VIDETAILERSELLDAGQRPRPYIVTVARLAEPHKGHELLLRTWPAVSVRHPDARCVIIGDGPLARRFRRVSHVAGASGSVVWLGQLDELHKWTVLSRSRALVMPSTIEPAAAQFEGFGLTYLEAAQVARPSIAADAAGPADVVDDGVTGLKVQPGDDIGLFEAIDRLIDDAGLATRLGLAAQKRVQQQGTWSARMPAVRSALAEAAE
jgi:phosphatidylinositol alpha-1,6-mannosyltransferase